MTPAPACQYVCVCVCVCVRMVLPGSDQTGRKFKCLCPDGKISYVSDPIYSMYDSCACLSVCVCVCVSVCERENGPARQRPEWEKVQVPLP